MKGLRSAQRTAFRSTNLHTAKEPHAVFYLKQRTSFWIATFSLFTFLIGNMVGQHGWYAFFASVLGQEDDSAIVYVGTTTPVEKVVDYGCWAEYGGDYKIHNFRQAPDSCKKTLPAYVGSRDRSDDAYSMQYMSSYAETTEHSGTHAGIDIRVPVGTPVRSAMNGRVVSVGDQPSGYGKFVVLKHPNVPDPANPTATTTLFSTYAHVSAVYVTEGDTVKLGDLVALSGDTGKVTGPHLHFQIDRKDAPYLPYFPSSMSDGYAYTVNAMTYVQSNLSAAPTLVADARTVAAERTQTEVPRTFSSSSHAAAPKPKETPAQILARLQTRREERLRQRLAERTIRAATVVAREETQVLPPVAAEEKPATVVQTEQIVEGAAVGIVATVEISHDGSFARGWEKVRVRLVDKDGNTVTSPRLDSDVVLRAEIGEAEFRPATLSPLDFDRGEATVNVLPRGRRALVIKAMPFNVLSQPMEYSR